MNPRHRHRIAAALVIAASACTRAPAAEPRPEPEPPARAAADSLRRQPLHTHGHDRITICVLQNGNLQEVRVRYNTQTGDTTVDGRPFSEVFPPDPPAYARAAPWMILNEPIPVRGRRYVKYAQPRVLGSTEVERVGEYAGTPLFREAGESGDPVILYIPVSPGCVFQPYENTANVGAVRG